MEWKRRVWELLCEERQDRTGMASEGTHTRGTSHNTYTIQLTEPAFYMSDQLALDFIYIVISIN